MSTNEYNREEKAYLLAHYRESIRQAAIAASTAAEAAARADEAAAYTKDIATALETASAAAYLAAAVAYTAATAAYNADEENAEELNDAAYLAGNAAYDAATAAYAANEADNDVFDDRDAQADADDALQTAFATHSHAAAYVAIEAGDYAYRAAEAAALAAKTLPPI
jgi:hypothetical protein